MPADLLARLDRVRSPGQELQLTAMIWLCVGSLEPQSLNPAAPTADPVS
jgi:hypothetical protein